MNRTSMEDQIDVAVNYMIGKNNCSQSILMAFGPGLGLPLELGRRSPLLRRGDRANGPRLWSGVGRVDGVGPAGGEQRPLRHGAERAFLYPGSGVHGGVPKAERGIQCRELLGIDLSTSQGLEQARKEGYSTSCAPSWCARRGRF